MTLTRYHNNVRFDGSRQSKSRGAYRLTLAALEMHLWCLLLDYRCYTSQLFLGFLFAAPSPASRAYFSWGYPDQERSNFEPELEELIIDCREQPIRRPKKGPKKYDCGKKRWHRLKTEIRLTAKGQIKSVSKSAPGQNTILRFIRQKSCPQLDI